MSKSMWMVKVVCLALPVALLSGGCGDDEPGGDAGVDASAAGSGGKDAAAGAGGSAAGSGGSGATGGSAGDAAAGSSGNDATADLDMAGSADGPIDGAIDTGALPADAAADSAADASMQTAGLMVTAASGGKLSGAGAALVIPAGALSADTMITVTAAAPGASVPSRDLIAGNVYDFGPTGTQFSKPVTLTLPLVGTPGAGKEASIAWLDPTTQQWVPLASNSAGSGVSAAISHFSMYAVLFLGTGGVCPFAGACGGSVDGTWQVTSACLPSGMPTSIAKCGDADVYLHQTLHFSGSLTVTQARYTFSHTLVSEQTVFYTPACLALINGNGAYPDCAAVETMLKANKEATWSCAGSLADGCSCTALSTPMESSEMGGVTLAGQQVTFLKDGSQSATPDDYCVKGNTLTVRDANGNVFAGVKQ